MAITMKQIYEDLGVIYGIEDIEKIDVKYLQRRYISLLNFTLGVLTANSQQIRFKKPLKVVK